MYSLILGVDFKIKAESILAMRLIGHNVVFATINHDFHPLKRGTLYLKPVVL